jgi:hypothetical protein
MQILVGSTQEKAGAETHLSFQRIGKILREIDQFLQQTDDKHKQIEKLLFEIQTLKTDFQVETFSRHVRAMGGRLELSVVFDEMQARLDLPLSKEAE